MQIEYGSPFFVIMTTTGTNGVSKYTEQKDNVFWATGIAKPVRTKKSRRLPPVDEPIWRSERFRDEPQAKLMNFRLQEKPTTPFLK